MKVMVIGAQPNSLGAAIREKLMYFGYTPVTAGVAGEGRAFDVLAMSVSEMVRAFDAVKPHHLVCTVGMNAPYGDDRTLDSWYGSHLRLNCVGPMKAIEAFHQYTELPGNHQRNEYQHAVAISSNSARIPRTNSAAYCASKAALSMALRCKARELGRAHSAVLVYGYEPGLLGGTPMTSTVSQEMAGVTMHRMPGVESGGLAPERVATMVVCNLEGGRELNGCLFPVDAGEI